MMPGPAEPDFINLRNAGYPAYNQASCAYIERATGF